ncbi:MAG: hypothetical protein A2V70_09820 [Planctomycetes bacterium RBG_13_63_9]|nr:MAG: hypothetical protein A2V70_09820 [Planctomycetes bacterium RBG_13_63_9]
MLNEGVIVNSASTLVKSEMVKQIRRLGRATSEELERAVFKALTGHDREEVGWGVEDNQAGCYTWLKSFEQLLGELIEDGYMIEEEPKTFTATPAEPQSEYSYLVYPSRQAS